MMVGRMTPVQVISIWQPRWKDRKVLIAKWKVGQHNKITFSKTKSMPGEYYLPGSLVTKCPLESNGKIQCYAVPMDELEPFERSQ